MSFFCLFFFYLFHLGRTGNGSKFHVFGAATRNAPICCSCDKANGGVNRPKIDSSRLSKAVSPSLFPRPTDRKETE
ncbi:hypothetical protein V8C42DRAFT_303802 [Trichoderma barbatum]